jgi:16S rRNA (guanine(966)-N(2))-methyltransferase RsmD
LHLPFQIGRIHFLDGNTAQVVSGCGMRIIAGEKRGFPLISPPGRDTRPTLGRVRESVFSIIGADVIDARVFDLFAGTGAFGLEALSRGAAHCTFVEKSHGALEALRKNVAKLAYESKSRVVAGDVLRLLTAETAAGVDLLFLDPPYAKMGRDGRHPGHPGGRIPVSRSEAAGTPGSSISIAHRTLTLLSSFPTPPSLQVIAQTGSGETLDETYGVLRCVRREKYGDTSVHFFLSFSN